MPFLSFIVNAYFFLLTRFQISSLRSKVARFQFPSLLSERGIRTSDYGLSENQAIFATMAQQI